MEQWGKAALAQVVEVEGGELIIDRAKDGEQIIIQSLGVSPLKNSFSTAFLE
jgi:hypothetical protein